MKIDIYVALSKLPKKVSTSQIATCSKALELVIPATHKCTGNHCGWMDTIIDQTDRVSQFKYLHCHRKLLSDSGELDG